MTDRPRLVHVTTTDISLALLLGPQLEAFAADYEVIGVSAPGPFVPDVERLGVRHVALRHATRAMAPHRDVAAYVELRSLFRKLRPAIVHTHNPKPGIYGRMAARAAGVPVVVNTVHGLYAQPGDRAIKRAVVYRLERMAARRSDAELVQNIEDLATLVDIGVPSDHLTLLGNGIDLRRFAPDTAGARDEVRRELGFTADEIVVGAVGRLVAEKGYRELIEAAIALRGQLPNARFVVVGPTDADKADGLGEVDRRRAEVEGGVMFVGLRRDIERLYAAMDLYVLASYREGFPRSAMEAAAMGLPIVATDIRGCRQVVERGINGLLVPSKDAHALADAIETLVRDESRRVAMGRAGRQKALSEFDQQRVIDTTLAVYERLLRTAGAGASR
jgi:glycosyltransferase involved in cell wall biosynthesis